jgi:hypothetical protein
MTYSKWTIKRSMPFAHPDRVDLSQLDAFQNSDDDFAAVSQ